MGKQFREGEKYTGEVIQGCSGNISSNAITVLRREGSQIAYRKNFGHDRDMAQEAQIQIMGDWGEYVEVGGDRFFAYTGEEA
jgi:hypothetical protein